MERESKMERVLEEEWNLDRSRRVLEMELELDQSRRGVGDGIGARSKLLSVLEKESKLGRSCRGCRRRNKRRLDVGQENKVRGVVDLHRDWGTTIGDTTQQCGVDLELAS